MNGWWREINWMLVLFKDREEFTPVQSGLSEPFANEDFKVWSAGWQRWFHIQTFLMTLKWISEAFFSHFDRKAMENWTAAAREDEWCNPGLRMCNHVKWLQGLWLSGRARTSIRKSDFSQDYQWKISGSVVVTKGLFVTSEGWCKMG